MLSGLGHIILTDFGSAKILDEGETSTTLAGESHSSSEGNPYMYSSIKGCFYSLF